MGISCDRAHPCPNQISHYFQYNFFNTPTGPPDSVGFAIYRSPRKLGVTIADGAKSWTVEVTDMIPANLWKSIGFSWNATQGLKV